MAKWVVTAKRADFEKIGNHFHIDPVIARILRNRDLIELEDYEKYFRGDLRGMYSPNLLKDMDKAVEKILSAIVEKQNIRVIGDYDVDGVCAGYILKEGLSLLSANVDYRVPNRVKDGYGLNKNLITWAKEDGVDLLITCDNGIAATEAIDYANDLGMTVIVTDHHEVPYVLDETGKKRYQMPNAYAVINPKREDCSYPFKGICGALVAYKVVQALFEKEKREMPSDFLEAAAFATVCDVMELKDENRIVVKNGLESLKNTNNLGLKALLLVCEIKKENLSAYHLGFNCGPCFNATGRLDIADRAIELLSCKNFDEAVCIARELKELNEQRKNMTMQGVKLAQQYVIDHHIEKDDVFVIYLPNCHESIAGIIAGRIKEEYNKPVIVLTKAEDGVKGSGRSIEAYDMYESFSACKEYFLKFGGHKMAAGVSLKEENIELLRQTLNENSTLTEEDFEEKIVIDVPMPISYISEKLIGELSMLEPFGVGNEKPVFAQKGITVLSEERVGKEKNVGKYKITDGNATMEMIYFGDLDAFHSFYKEMGTISIAYYPTINEYMGRKKLQVVLKAYKEA